MADESKPFQTLREAFDRILTLIPFHSEGEKQEIGETLDRELFQKVGRNTTDAGVVKDDKAETTPTDAKNENPFPTPPATQE